MATLPSNSNSGMLIGALIVAIVAIAGYAIYQHNHRSVSIELPGISAKVKAD